MDKKKQNIGMSVRKDCFFEICTNYMCLSGWKDSVWNYKKHEDTTLSLSLVNEKYKVSLKSVRETLV